MTEALNQLEAIALLQASPLGVVATDQEQIIWINRQAEVLLGLDSQGLCGEAIDCLPAWLKAIFFSGEEQAQLRAESGSEFMVTLKHIEGGRISRVCFLSDASEISQLQGKIGDLEARLGVLDTRDDSSGLLNRRGLYQVLESQVSRSRRYGNPLSLLSLQINDYGLGEDNKVAVLTALGYLFNDRLRWADSVGRIEDDEFIIVLPETEVESAANLVEKLMVELQGLRLEGNGKAVTLAASYGIAAWREGDDPSRLLLRCQADRQPDLRAEG